MSTVIFKAENIDNLTKRIALNCICSINQADTVVVYIDRPTLYIVEATSGDADLTSADHKLYQAMSNLFDLNINISFDWNMTGYTYKPHRLKGTRNGYKRF